MEKLNVEKKGEVVSTDTKEWRIPIEKKWEEIFSGWIDKIDKEKLTLNLFELKLWFEGLEEFNSSTYLENLIFKIQPPSERNYDFYLFTFQHVTNRIIMLLKELDFKKDKFFLNFEEFIVEKLLEEFTENSFSNLRQIYSPESWFYSFRIFLQNFRLLIAELQKIEVITQKVFSSMKKLYHRELISNPMLISLIRNQFIPQLDRISHSEISGIITGAKDKKLKKELGIFFVLSFQTVKVIDILELHLNKSRNVEITVPLVIMLKKNMEGLDQYINKTVLQTLEGNYSEKEGILEVKETFYNFVFEIKKIFEGELPFFFSSESNKIGKRRTLRNIIVIARLALQEMIASVALMVKNDIRIQDVFSEYIPRRENLNQALKKLKFLYEKINYYFVRKGNVQPSEIMLDIQLFMEKDLHTLYFAKWNEFNWHFRQLSQAGIPGDFEPLLRKFHAFLADLCGAKRKG